MKYKDQFIRLFISLFRLLLILSLGSIVLYYLSHYLFSGLEFAYLLLVIPILLVILFGMVAFTISELLHLQAWYGEEMTYPYTRKELLSLYVRSFLVVTSGVGLVLLFDAFNQDPSLSSFRVIFYGLDLFLTLFAIGNIIKSEKLRELNIRRIQSENLLLKSQLNPHFLYNTLNNIDSLIFFDTQKASEAIIKLSSLLRYMTYQGNKKQVLLCDELKYLQEYISLQQLRIGNPNAIVFEITLQEDSLQIAPMVLMPFIENIFKHASDKMHDGAIKIQIHANTHQLNLQTENGIALNQENRPKEGGVGLHNVKRRLKLLYPNRHQLEIIQQDQKYFINLNLYLK